MRRGRRAESGLRRRGHLLRVRAARRSRSNDGGAARGAGARAAFVYAPVPLAPVSRAPQDNEREDRSSQTQGNLRPRNGGSRDDSLFFFFNNPPPPEISPFPPRDAFPI